MYKRKSMQLRRVLAMIFAVVIISGQLETVAYAKETTLQPDVQLVTTSQNGTGSLEAQSEVKYKDDIEQGSSLKEEETNDIDSENNQNEQNEEDLEDDKLGEEITNEPNVNDEQNTEPRENEAENGSEDNEKAAPVEENKEEENNFIENIDQNENAFVSDQKDYDNLKNAVTKSHSGYENGLGTASNFGIFVNGLFSATAKFEANLAVRNMYSRKTPQVQCCDDSPTLAQQVIYIQNFADANGNVLNNNPLPVNYNLQLPGAVLGSGYVVDGTMEEGNAYGIDGKKLGWKSNIVQLMQDPEGSQFVDFDTEFSYLNSLSTYLASLATTKTASVETNGNSMLLGSGSQQVDIINLSSVDFTTDSKVDTNINLQNNVTYIINVDMSDIADFEWNTQVSINGKSANFLDEAGKVLWNFYTKEIDGNGEVIYKPYEGRLATTALMQGTFLAPSATVEIGAGNFNGSIVAKNLVSNTSAINKVTFRGTVPEDGAKKSDTTTGGTTINVTKSATYTGDFDSSNNKGRRTYQVDLSATATPVVTEIEEHTPNDIVLVLDRSGSMLEKGASGKVRLQELMEAAKAFVNAIKKSSPESTVNIISFSSDDNVKAVSDDTGGFVNVVSGYDTIIKAIYGLGARGATRTDLGMQYAYNNLNQANIRNNGKPKTVVLFSDGVPTMTNVFDDGVANEAKKYATKIKSEFGGTIFTIGLLSTLNTQEKPKAEAFLNEMASYKKDSQSEKRFYQTTDELSLEDIFIKISSEITGEVVGATVRDYISEYFVLTEECKNELDNIDNVSYGYDKSSKRWYVEWKNQTIPIEGNWSSTISIEAKSEFIGGNDISTNASASGIYLGNISLAIFPQPKVNVPVKFDVGDEETTIRYGQLIPTKLYDKELDKEEYVQTLMFNEKSKPDIFLGKKETGKFTYQWYWGTEPIGEGKTLESLIEGVIIDKETVLTLKVRFEPYNTDTSTDGRKGLAESTPHTGTYTIHLIFSGEKDLWVNKFATYTGNFNSEDNTGKRTYVVKLVANTVQKGLKTSGANDIVLVLNRSQSLEKQYMDKAVKKHYLNLLEREKESAIEFVNSIKESSPESNICVISYASGAINETAGFKNVSNEYNSIIQAINNMRASGEERPDLGLEEAYNVLNNKSIKSNGRAKAVVFCSAVHPDQESQNTANIYTQLLKNRFLADLYTVKVWTKKNELADIVKELDGAIAGANVIDYIDERFQFTEETKKMFEKDNNILYGFDSSRNQWYVKYLNQVIPNNNSVWFKEFEVEAKDAYIGGNNILTNGKDSGIYIEDKKLKDFPKPRVNVPVKFVVGNQETTIFYGEEVPQQLYDANTLKYKDVQTLMFDEKSQPDIFLGKGATGTFKYEWYLGEILIGQGKDLNTLVENVELDKEQLYTLKVTFIPDNQKNPPDDGKGLAKDTSHTGTYLVHVVKGALTIQKNIDSQYTDIEKIRSNQSFVFEIKRYAVNKDGSKGDYIESYYETINFAANEGITSKDTKIINLKKGYYQVVEDTDWSWKYNLVSVKDNDIYSNAENGIVYVGNKNNSISSDHHYFGEMNVESALARIEFVNQKNEINWLGDVSAAINKFK